MMKNKKVYILLVIIIFLSGCLTGQKEKAIVKDVIIGELEGNEHVISFFVVNKNNEIGDCLVKIMMNDELHNIFAIGVLNPGEEKFFEKIIEFEEGELSMKIFAECEWLTQKEAETCNSQDLGERKLCRLTLDKPELEQCLTGNIIPYKFFCIALTTKDPQVCNYIRLDSKRNWCRAYVTGNLSFCEAIQSDEGKDECYTDIGINFRDPSICDNIKDEKSKTSCIASATKNPELCLKGAEQYKSSCIMNVIEATGNKELCNLLSNEQKEECIEQTK